MLKSKQHQIVLSLDPSGILTVDRPSVRVSRRDTIRWTSDLPFAVEFTPSSPCDRLKGSSSGGSLKMKVRGDSGPGRYEYFVAVYDGHRVVTEDPVIIIEAV
jgi:hypothetical protein